MEVLIVGLVGVMVSTMMSHRRKIPEQIGRMLSEADLLAVDGEDRVVAHRKEGHRNDWVVISMKDWAEIRGSHRSFVASSSRFSLTIWD